MQLKVQRSQRTGGAFGGKIIFVLDIRAEYTEPERNNIRRFRFTGHRWSRHDSHALSQHKMTRMNPSQIPTRDLFERAC